MKKFLENTKSFREKLITSRRVFALKRLRRLYKHKRNILNKNFLDILGNLKGFNLKIFIYENAYYHKKNTKLNFINSFLVKRCNT